MAKLTRSIMIKAPVDEVFDFALDVGRLWTVVRDLAARDVVLTPDGVGSKATIYTHVLGFHMEGVVEFVEVVRPERIRAIVHFTGEKPEWTFTFEPVEGDTKLTIQGEWHANIPKVGPAIETAMAKSHESMATEMLEAVKARVEA